MIDLIMFMLNGEKKHEDEKKKQNILWLNLSRFYFNENFARDLKFFILLKIRYL